MAKAKKAVAITLEERLEQALVPEAEQPYTVPENWCWTKFFTVLNYEQPTEYIVESTEYKDEHPIPVLTAGKSFILGYTDETLGICRELPVIIFDDFTTDSKFVDFPFKVKSSAMKILHPATEIKLRFIYYYMQTVDCDNSEHRRFWISTYSQLPFPIPPFPEQQRIVDRIESLFTKLDEAKEKAQAALDSFETRKAAILHKAFTGELTAKWREENGLGMDSWKEKRINEISKPKAGYAFDSKLFSTHGFQIVRMGNLFGGELDLSRTPVFINESNVDPSIIDKFLIRKGDILLTLTGTKYKRDYGYAVKIENNSPCLLNQRILSLTPNNGVVPNFILYYLRSDIFREIFFSNETGGVNQGNVSSKFVESIEVMLPQSLEQSEIVRLLDDFFTKEQKAKELCSVIDNIDLIKKSILARAFRGELGTNDPAEESAVELLKSIV